MRPRDEESQREEDDWRQEQERRDQEEAEDRMEAAREADRLIFDAEYIDMLAGIDPPDWYDVLNEGVQSAGEFLEALTDA